MNPFLCGPKELSHEWRSLREKLSEEKTDLEHMKLVAEFWAKCPLTSPFIDWDNPVTWLDPWELMASKMFDNSSVALGIEYTLLLGKDERWNSDRVQIHLVTDVDKTMQHLVVIVDNKHVLNYDYSSVFSYSDHLISHAKFKYDNKKHCEIKV